MSFSIKIKPIIAITPKCKNCKFYLKGDNPNLSKCSKFINLTNKSFEFAEICRMNIDLCGPRGYYFEENGFYDFNNFNDF